jgi:hypothetical protein
MYFSRRLRLPIAFKLPVKEVVTFAVLVRHYLLAVIEKLYHQLKLIDELQYH